MEVCVFLSISFVRVFFARLWFYPRVSAAFLPFLCLIFLHLVFVEEEEEEVEEAAGVGEGEEDGGGRKKNKEEEENKKGDLNPWRWCCGECDIFMFFFFLVWLLKYGRGISGEEASGSKTSIREGDLCRRRLVVRILIIIIICFFFFFLFLYLAIRFPLLSRRCRVVLFLTATETLRFHCSRLTMRHLVSFSLGMFERRWIIS